MNSMGHAATRTAIVLAAMWAGQAAAATAGAFQFVAGEVRVILAAGSERPASKGSPVEVGDTIATAKNGMAQIKMGDGAIVVVQPESRVTVAEYRYSGAEDGTEKVQFRLEQGGIRALTGAIGHTHKGNYSIETPIAHIGVRGTDHESYYFPAGRAGEAGAKPGVYNKVNTGLTFIRTDSGEVVIGPSQVGYAASAQDLPRLLTTIPEFFNRSIEPKASRRESGTQVASGQHRSSDPQVVQAVTTTNGVNLSDPHFASLAGYTGPAAGEEDEGVSFGRSHVSPNIAPNGATLVNAGGDPKFGVNWGSWQSGVATVNGLATTGSTHYINSIDPTSATQLASLGSSLVSATYKYMSGPAPTNQLGTQGTITSLSVGVNFSAQSITGYTVNAYIPATSTVAATTWNANGGGTISQFTGPSGIALMGTCSGCASGGTPAANGTANGAFVGSAAEKMITSFGLKAANQAIAGVGYLSR